LFETAELKVTTGLKNVSFQSIKGNKWTMESSD